MLLPTFVPMSTSAASSSMHYIIWLLHLLHQTKEQWTPWLMEALESVSRKIIFLYHSIIGPLSSSELRIILTLHNSNTSSYLHFVVNVNIKLWSNQQSKHNSKKVFSSYFWFCQCEDIKYKSVMKCERCWEIGEMKFSHQLLKFE